MDMCVQFISPASTEENIRNKSCNWQYQFSHDSDSSLFREASKLWNYTSGIYEYSVLRNAVNVR